MGSDGQSIGNWGAENPCSDQHTLIGDTFWGVLDVARLCDLC